MKLRIPNELNADIARRAGLLGMPQAEIVRRALRQYRVECGVVVADFRATATRDDSTPQDIDIPPGLCGSLRGWELCAVVRWALDRTETEQKPLELEGEA